MPEPTRFAVWALALVIDLATPILAWRALPGATVAHAAHIAERFGLFTLIVLGETVVAVAVGTAGTDWHPRAVLVAVGGFIVAMSLWWSYFGAFDAGTFRVVLRRGLLPSFLYGYGHLPLYAGLAALGAGTQLAIEGAGATLDGGARAALCGGVAVALVAISVVQLVTRRSVHDSLLVARLAAAVGAVLLAVLGDSLYPLTLVGLLALVLVGLTAFEIARARPAGHDAEINPSHDLRAPEIG